METNEGDNTGKMSEICDINWRFKVTAASHDSNCFTKSSVNLKLVIRDVRNEGFEVPTKTMYIEMTIAQFYKFLHDLEKIKCDTDAPLHKRFTLNEFYKRKKINKCV